MKKAFFHVIIWMNCLPFCTEDLTPPSATNQVLITTSPLSSITSSSVMFDVTVVSDGGNAITQRGIVVDTYFNPTVNDRKKIVGSGLGRFSDTITLSSNTTYYLRPYTINSLGTVYGDQETFRTLLTTPTLLAPTNASQEHCCSVSFQWTSVTGASSYELEIARNSSFSGSAYTIGNCTSSTTLQYNSVNNVTVTSNSFCVRAGTAVNNGTWYWHVRARNSANYSNWSAVRSFSYVY